MRWFSCLVFLVLGCADMSPTVTTLPNPPAPGAEVNGLAWTSDGNYLAVAINESPNLVWYSHDGVGGFTKLTIDSGDLPDYAVAAVGWDPTNTYLLSVGGGDPSDAGYRLYKRTGDTLELVDDDFASEYGNWATQIAWDSTGTYAWVSLIYGEAGDGYLWFKLDRETDQLTELTNPILDPDHPSYYSAAGMGAAWVGNYLICGHGDFGPPIGVHLTVFERSGDTLTVVPDAVDWDGTTPIPVEAIYFDSTGTYLAVLLADSDRVLAIFKWDEATETLTHLDNEFSVAGEALNGLTGAWNPGTLEFMFSWSGDYLPPDWTNSLYIDWGTVDDNGFTAWERSDVWVGEWSDENIGWDPHGIIVTGGYGQYDPTYSGIPPYLLAYSAAALVEGLVAKLLPLENTIGSQNISQITNTWYPWDREVADNHWANEWWYLDDEDLPDGMTERPWSEVGNVQKNGYIFFPAPPQYDTDKYRFRMHSNGSGDEYRWTIINQSFFLRVGPYWSHYKEDWDGEPEVTLAFQQDPDAGETIYGSFMAEVHEVAGVMKLQGLISFTWRTTSSPYTYYYNESAALDIPYDGDLHKYWMFKHETNLDDTSKLSFYTHSGHKDDDWVLRFFLDNIDEEIKFNRMRIQAEIELDGYTVDEVAAGWRPAYFGPLNSHLNSELEVPMTNQVHPVPTPLTGLVAVDLKNEIED